ncbi:MAG TPA: deoxyribose-phosphate aldolase [Bacteroidales bacterium]|nr:deoxyribose-phosphate aldolase [Bacteroidales bacterium]
MNYAQYIDHSLLHPTATSKDITRLCNEAVQFEVAAVCIQPVFVSLAHRLLKNTEISVATVVGFPLGACTQEIKYEETKQCIQLGANEIDAVVCISKVIEEDWEYVTTEINELSTICKQYNICLKIIFETTYLNENQIIKLCEICTKASVNFVKTSTGFDFVKQEQGTYITIGAQLQHIQLMRKHCGSNVQIKASGGIRTTEYFLSCIQAGANRIGTSATKDILKGL